MSPQPRPADSGAPRRWTRRRLTGAALTAAAALVASCVIGSSAPAQAKTYPSGHAVAAAKHAAKHKAHQVKAIQAALDAAEARLVTAQNNAEIAAERYNEAKAVLATRTHEANATKKAAAQAAVKAGAAQRQIGALAADAYMNGGMGDLASIVSSQGPEQVLDRADALQVVGGIRQQTYSDASQTKVVAGILKHKADVALTRQAAAAAAASAAKAAAVAQANAAASAKASIAAQRSHLVAQLAHLQKISVHLAKARVAGIARHKRILAARRARAAARAAAHNAGAGGGGGGGGGGYSSGTASGGLVAVAYARSQIGKWYEWAAAGPARFDCSGLTMRAWQRAGVYLPHYSVAQYADTQHVPVSQARPGDLVFFATNTSNPGSIHHVAIYIGNGQMVEAPHTGAQVRVSSIWRYGLMAYAGRP